MKSSTLIIGLIFCVLLSSPLFSQSPVDDLIQTLEDLSTSRFDAWQYTTRITGDPSEVLRLSEPGYDDSSWETLMLNESIYVDSCWLRKEIELPPHLAGHTVEGPLSFLVSVDDYGYLWANGESLGHFPWNGEFVLTKNSRPGMRFVLLIKAINTGGPLRLIRARVSSEKLKPVQEAITGFALNFRVGKKLLGFDTYQTNDRVRTDPGIDRSRIDPAEKKQLARLLDDLAQQVDVEALRAGDYSAYTVSIDKVRRRLKPIKEFAKRFTLTFDSNAHIDAAWLWRMKETVEVAHRTFGSVLNMMNVRPDFTYTQSQAVMYEWMQTLYPDIFKDIQNRVKQGRWELIGGMWVEPDCNLPAGESWVRQLLYGQRFFEEHFGQRVRIGWNPDSFGYNWNMPQFFSKAGIDAFITQKIGWNDTSVFPYRLFWWEAPDGSRILAYFPFTYVDTIENPFRLIDWMRQYEANTGITRLLVLFGVGDHGGGPSLEMMERIDRLRKLEVYPRIEFGTATDYLDWVKAQDLSDLPVWKDELYLEYHRGTYTTQANTKKWNRKSETLLKQAETFSALDMLYGSHYHANDLEEAWKVVLFNQFHDILPGSSIREVYYDSDQQYREAYAIGEHLLKNALSNLAGHVDTQSLKGSPVVVFNSLSWDRTDLVRVRLPEDAPGPLAVFDVKGKEVPSQTVRVRKFVKEILFVAEDVPGMGYRTYTLRPKTPSARSPGLSISSDLIENEFFRVSLDSEQGWVKSIVDKETGREVLEEFGNRLQVFEDNPTAWDAWNIGLGKEFPTIFRKAEIVEKGPVRVVLRITRDFLKAPERSRYPTEDFPTSFFEQDIILTRGVDRIEFKTDVEWWEDKMMLKVAFPVTVHDTVATYEIPYGSIQRSTTLTAPLDKGKWEVPALRWADLSSDGFGVSLLNRTKYGHDIKGNVMRLSLLRAPEWPDPAADRGNHSIEYALYPHRGEWNEDRTVHQGYAYNTPLQAVITDVHTGDMPLAQQFVRLEPENLVLTSIKKAEDEAGTWIVQWYDALGRNSEAALTLPGRPREAVLSNFLEDDKTPLPIALNTIHVPTGKNEIVTVKVRF